MFKVGDKVIVINRQIFANKVLTIRKIDPKIETGVGNVYYFEEATGWAMEHWLQNYTNSNDVLKDLCSK
jgi:hypothetical protein